MNNVLTVAGVFSILLSVWLAHRLTIGRDHIKAFKGACEKFRSAFSEAKANLSSGTIDAHAVLSKFRAQHDAAIIEFRCHVSRWKRKRFNATCETFSRCRERIKPGLLEFCEAEVTGKLRDHGDIQNLCVTINDLLAFADET